MASKKKCQPFFGHTVFKVEDNNRKVFFKTANGDEVSMDYDFLHLVPPQTAPEFIAQSGLAAANGFIDVDTRTLRSTKFTNIFGLGDAANLPTAKTAAGVFSQVPVVVHNLLNQMESKQLNAFYDGYNSCPLFTGDKQLMLVEFKYDNLPSETFYNG